MSREPVESPLITTAEALDDLVAHLRAAGRFAFDTEFVSEETFEPELCLVQVATDERLAVVDPLAVRDLSGFWAAVADPAIEVVMHAAGEDLRIGKIKTGLVPARVFDVQIAVGLLGPGYPLSLGNVVSQRLGISLAGGETRTDWRRRPLSPAQLRYALDDVRFLLDLADGMKAELAERGRTDWAEAEFADFLGAIRDRSEEERWRRLPGLHMLNRRGLETARRLAEWRYEDARRANRPLRALLKDDLLVAIAKRQPATRAALVALRDFNRPHLLNRSAEILDVIAAALAAPVDDLPVPPERHDERPGVAMVVSLLSATLARCCGQSRVAVGLVGGASDLRDLIRWHLAGRPDDRRPSLARGWRWEICGQTLMDVLTGRRALRVVDPEADVPVALDPVEE
ncbi:MAG TPA: ribonuclease D [Isosphaeraceae bacterium]|jgi:ribonuclease D